MNLWNRIGMTLGRVLRYFITTYEPEPDPAKIKAAWKHGWMAAMHNVRLGNEQSPLGSGHQLEDDKLAELNKGMNGVCGRGWVGSDGHLWLRFDGKGKDIDDWNPNEKPIAPVESKRAPFPGPKLDEAVRRDLDELLGG